MLFICLFHGTILYIKTVFEKKIEIQDLVHLEQIDQWTKFWISLPIINVVEKVPMRYCVQGYACKGQNPGKGVDHPKL